MNTSIKVVLLWLALSVFLRAGAQVIERDEPKLLKTTKVDRATSHMTVKLWALPATVKLAGGRSEEGGFLILTEPSKKFYWWQFFAGTDPKNSGVLADYFLSACRLVVEEEKLWVFCTTDRYLLVGSSVRVYPSESKIGQLVLSEFDQRAAQLDSGFDYFDKNINLWPVLGADFFAEPNHAEGIRRIGLGEIKRSGDSWEVVVIGAKPFSARLKFSADFVLQRSELFR